MGVSEINTRTCLYIFFMFSFLVIRYLVLEKDVIKTFVLVLFSFLGISANFNNAKSLYFNGSGRLADAKFKSDAPMIETTKKLIVKMRLHPTDVFSNEPSILSLYTDYKIPNNLPTYRRFMGNSYENNFQMFETQKKVFLNHLDSIDKKGWLITYFFMNPSHPRFDSLQLNLVRTISLTNDVNFILTTHGYIISNKKQ
jgi:hypothetical protein